MNANKQTSLPPAAALERELFRLYLTTSFQPRFVPKPSELHLFFVIVINFAFNLIFLHVIGSFKRTGHC